MKIQRDENDEKRMKIWGCQNGPKFGDDNLGMKIGGVGGGQDLGMKILGQDLGAFGVTCGANIPGASYVSQS